MVSRNGNVKSNSVRQKGDVIHDNTLNFCFVFIVFSARTQFKIENTNKEQISIIYKQCKVQFPEPLSYTKNIEVSLCCTFSNQKYNNDQ